MNTVSRQTLNLHKHVRLRWLSTSSVQQGSDEITHYPDDPSITVPVYTPSADEPIEQQRARLVYQSRKRGMLENDLLLSSFASKYLKAFDKKQLDVYDRLINDVSNEWNLYYWITKREPTPVQYDSEIMDALKEHVNNNNKELRSRQPDLY